MWEIMLGYRGLVGQPLKDMHEEGLYYYFSKLAFFNFRFQTCYLYYSFYTFRVFMDFMYFRLDHGVYVIMYGY